MTETSSPKPGSLRNLSASHGIYRSRTNRRIKGVCGGIAERYGVDPSIVRIAFVLVTLFLMANVTGWAMFAYLVAALLVHERPSSPSYIDVDATGR